MHQDIRQLDKAGQASIQATFAGLGARSVRPFLKDCAVKKIKLTQGKYALVDDEDFEKLNQHKWHAVADGYSFYAARSIYVCIKGKWQYFKTERMHRAIVNAPEGLEIDHINHNSLDNRKGNLRICTHAENLRNQKSRKGCLSKYKGVRLDKKCKIKDPENIVLNIRVFTGKPITRNGYQRFFVMAKTIILDISIMK